MQGAPRRPHARAVSARLRALRRAHDGGALRLVRTGGSGDFPRKGRYDRALPQVEPQAGQRRAGRAARLGARREGRHGDGRRGQQQQPQHARRNPRLRADAARTRRRSDRHHPGRGASRRHARGRALAGPRGLRRNPRGVQGRSRALQPRHALVHAGTQHAQQPALGRLRHRYRHDRLRRPRRLPRRRMADDRRGKGESSQPSASRTGFSRRCKKERRK